jgi:recombination protein RecA
VNKEEARRHAILRKLASLPEHRAAALRTGAAKLDRILAGGWPRGGIVEIFGAPAAGKTTLLLRSAANLQSQGLTVAWIDADHTFDPAYASALGVRVDAMPVAQPGSAEEAMEIGLRLTLTRAVDLLVIDSAAALVPQLELEANVGDSSPGLHARVLASGLRKLAGAARRTATAVAFTNHARNVPGAAVEQVETSAGGPPLKLHTAVRIAVEPASDGICVRARKNRLSAAVRECITAGDWTRDVAEGP